jgi:phage-related minor tail protein
MPGRTPADRPANAGSSHHQKEQIMARNKIDVPTQIPEAAARPLYAGVGVTDRVVGAVRDYVADMQKRVTEVQKSVADFEVESLTSYLGKDAQARRARVEKRVGELQAEAFALPTRLQKLVDEQVATAGDTYESLVKRGESLVGRIRRQQSTQVAVSSAKTTTAKAKTTRTQATKAAKKTTTTAKKATKSTAKKAASTAKKTSAAPKSSAKATATAAKETVASAAAATTDAATKIGD